MTALLSRPFPSFPAVRRVTKSASSIKASVSFNQYSSFKRDYTSVMIVPTGVGAAIDCLITHPNVLNAAMMYWPMPNALYAEGLWGLKPVHQNKSLAWLVPVVEYVVTDTPLQVEKWIDPQSGQSTGRIKHPESLLTWNTCSFLLLIIILLQPLIIFVEENETVLDDTPDKVGIEPIKVSNYWEAIGVVAAHKAGINPQSLRRNRISNLRRTTVLHTNGHAVQYTSRKG